MRHLPNALSFVRIVATPYIVWLLLEGRCSAALPVSLVAGLTDALDGYAARRLGVESRFGAQLDPIADKVMLMSLYLAFGWIGAVPPWLTALVVGRDVLILAMVAAGLLLTRVRDFPPLVSGKVSTVIQISAALVFLGACREPAGTLPQLAIIAVALGTLWSGLRYVQRAFQLLQGEKPKV